MPPKAANLLPRADVGCLKGLLDTLMGLDDDSPAECSIYRSSRKQGHSAREDTSSDTLLIDPDVEYFQGFALAHGQQ
jgi:hypothetical protein